MKYHFSWRRTATSCAFLAGMSSALGQNYAIDWNTIDSGSGTSAGGVYAVSGTIGQPDAGVMSGGTYGLAGGFWSLFSNIQTVGPPPAMAIRRGAGNTVILSWPNPSFGYFLQQTANMNGPGGGWVDVTATPVVVGPNKEVTLPATGSFCIFRLRP